MKKLDRKTKKNIYFWTTALLTSMNIVVIVILAIYVRDKAWVTIYSVFTIYVVNTSLSFWIVNSKKRTTRTKISWLLAFLVFPLLGLIVFGIWGRNPYSFRTKQNYYKLEKKYIDLYNYGLLDKLNDSTEHTSFKDFLSLAMFNYNTCYEPVYANDKIKVLQYGKDFYDAIFEAVEKAQKSICMQYYILDEGFFLNTLFAKLLEKAEEGVQIYILYDRFGCMGKLNRALIWK